MAVEGGFAPELYSAGAESGGGVEAPGKGGRRGLKGREMALEEVGQVEGAGEDAGVVHVEDGVPSKAGVPGEVAATEERKKQGSTAQGGAGAAEGTHGLGGARPPGAGPESAMGDLKGGGGEGEAQEATGAGRAPVREAGSGGEGEGEEGAEVRGEGEGERGLKTGELGLGESRAEGDGRGAEVGEDVLGEGAVGVEAAATGGGGGSSGSAGGEAAEAGGVGGCRGRHVAVDVHHGSRSAQIMGGLWFGDGRRLRLLFGVGATEANLLGEGGREQ